MVLTGEVGSGKTTVLRTLLNHLPADRYRTALIFNPSLSSSELLHTINRELGIPSETSNHSSPLGCPQPVSSPREYGGPHRRPRH